MRLWGSTKKRNSIVYTNQNNCFAVECKVSYQISSNGNTHSVKRLVKHWSSFWQMCVLREVPFFLLHNIDAKKRECCKIGGRVTESVIANTIRTKRLSGRCWVLPTKVSTNQLWEMWLNFLLPWMLWIARKCKNADWGQTFELEFWMCAKYL